MRTRRSATRLLGADKQHRRGAKVGGQSNTYRLGLDTPRSTPLAVQVVLFPGFSAQQAQAVVSETDTLLDAVTLQIGSIKPVDKTAVPRLLGGGQEPLEFDDVESLRDRYGCDGHLRNRAAPHESWVRKHSEITYGGHDASAIAKAYPYQGITIVFVPFGDLDGSDSLSGFAMAHLGGMRRHYVFVDLADRYSTQAHAEIVVHEIAHVCGVGHHEELMHEQGACEEVPNQAGVYEGTGNKLRPGEQDQILNYARGITAGSCPGPDSP